MATQFHYPPGARVLIRDEEWLIRRADLTQDADWLLNCDGISDLVRGQNALFLTSLEDEITLLNPAETQLVPDLSPKYNDSMLFLESHLRRSVPNDQQIHLGHHGVMNLVPYQLDPALQALKQPRARILIADAVGLGKTLEAGILATELMQRGRGKRILVITQKAMLTQFQKEWWSRFSIPLVRLDSVGLNRVRNRIPANHNPFNHFDKSIISMDTLKSNLEYRNYLENAWWDIIVIDECHNVAERAGESGISKRAKLARLLANRSDTLMLLSATPHDGSARSFASLMTLLDPTAISDPDDYVPDDFRNKGLVIRRFKKDIKDQVSADFKERITLKLSVQASAHEEAAYRALLAIEFTQSGKHNAGKAQQLQRIGMQKALFSSPAAALDSAQRRVKILSQKPDISPDEQNEITGLQDFIICLEAMVNDPSASQLSKYQRLLQELKSSQFAWKVQNTQDRLVIFSERIETLHWLRQQLQTDLKLKAEQLEVLHGTMPDTEQQSLVDRFGRSDDPLRVLLCSDVASEGLNLHYFCHRLVHFDLPWSLMVFQQRNGRVDRYGQNEQPQIIYLFTEAQNEKIKGDQRILQVLEAKDEQANKNLGDPSAFLKIYDPEKEAEKVAELMAEGKSADEFEALLNSISTNQDLNEADLLLSLFGGANDNDDDNNQPAQPAPSQLNNTSSPSQPSALSKIAERHSLFNDDFHYAQTALIQINKIKEQCQWSANEVDQFITITAPKDLENRLEQLPTEVKSANNSYALCANKTKIIEAIEQARQAKAEQESWPQLHYLWAQHPIMEWLGDRVLTAFGRHRAPVIACPQLPPNQPAYILMSLIPNRKGQPLLVDWQVACINGTQLHLESFANFSQRIQLKASSLANAGQTANLQSAINLLQSQLPQAVNAMNLHMVQIEADFSLQLQQRLAGTLKELEVLQSKQIHQLELNLAQQIEAVKNARFERRSEQIKRVFDDYREWVKDTLSTEPQPYIQVLAALYHPNHTALGK